MTPDIQVDHARRTVLAVARADLTTLIVTGKDRVTWLNGMLTCELVKRRPGAAVYGLAVARSGRIISDAIVVVGGDPVLADDADAAPGARGSVLMAVPETVSRALRGHLERYIVMEDAEIAFGQDDLDVWTIVGPRSGEVLDAARGAGALGASFDPTGLGGSVVFAPKGRADVHASIEKAVALASGVVGDETGWGALRIERALPKFGVDFDDKSYPQEAQLEKTAVSFDKGCYLGQEVVFMLEKRGHVKRKLAALVLDSRVPPERGAVVVDGAGESVGEITSAVSSPTLGRPVALAMVKRACATPGQSLTVDGARAEVVERPA